MFNVYYGFLKEENIDRKCDSLFPGYFKRYVNYLAIGITWLLDK